MTRSGCLFLSIIGIVVCLYMTIDFAVCTASGRLWPPFLESGSVSYGDDGGSEREKWSCYMRTLDIPTRDQPPYFGWKYFTNPWAADRWRYNGPDDD